MERNLVGLQKENLWLLQNTKGWGYKMQQKVLQITFNMIFGPYKN